MSGDPVVMQVGAFEFTLENLSESDDHLRWVIEHHTPPPNKDFCPECDLRSPCDTASLAASGLARSADLDALRAELARAEAERDVLRSAFEHLERDHGCKAYPRVPVTLRATPAADPVQDGGDR